MKNWNLFLAAALIGLSTSAGAQASALSGPEARVEFRECSRDVARAWNQGTLGRGMDVAQSLVTYCSRSLAAAERSQFGLESVIDYRDLRKSLRESDVMPRSSEDFALAVEEIEQKYGKDKINDPHHIEYLLRGVARRAGF